VLRGCHDVGVVKVVRVGRREEGVMLGRESQLGVEQHGVKPGGQMLIETRMKEERVQARGGWCGGRRWADAHVWTRM